MITIDGQQYDPDTLPESAKQQIASVNFVDNEIARLKSTLAVMQTARLTYARALKEELDKIPTQLLPKDSGTIQFN
jgi:hypothetical protein